MNWWLSIATEEEQRTSTATAIREDGRCSSVEKDPSFDLSFASNRAKALAAMAIVAALAVSLSGCKRNDFPSYPAGYREYAYITNSGSNTVTVLDIVNMRQDRVLRVGVDPSGVSANALRREVYVVNSGSGTVSVIDGRTNTVAATIAVHKQPYFIDVDKFGRRAYVANSGSDNVSVLDLASRREIGTIRAGEAPGLARISPDGNTLVITNRVSGNVILADPRTFQARSTFGPCPGATDAVILPDSSKTFIACSGGHQVMVLGLAHRTGTDGTGADEIGTNAAGQSGAADRLLTMLDVGETPIQLALKPDGGEVFVSNYGSGTISEIDTSTNEVGGAYLIGSHPVRGLVSADNSLLYVSTFGTGRVGVYSIEDGKLSGSVKVGEGPDALAFSADGRLLFVADAESGDIAVMRTDAPGPRLLTLFPAARRPEGIAVEAFPGP